jgi:hypothetical protein
MVKSWKKNMLNVFKGMTCPPLLMIAVILSKGQGLYREERSNLGQMKIALYLMGVESVNMPKMQNKLLKCYHETGFHLFHGTDDAK